MNYRFKDRENLIYQKRDLYNTNKLSRYYINLEYFYAEGT